MRSPKKNNKGGGGFIQATLVVLAALVLLKYVYSVDVVGFLTAGRFKELLDQFYELGSRGWIKYRDVIIQVWGSVINFIKNIFD